MIQIIDRWTIVWARTAMNRLLVNVVQKRKAFRCHSLLGTVWYIGESHVSVKGNMSRCSLAMLLQHDAQKSNILLLYPRSGPRLSWMFQEIISSSAKKALVNHLF